MKKNQSEVYIVENKTNASFDTVCDGVGASEQDTARNGGSLSEVERVAESVLERYKNAFMELAK